MKKMNNLNMICEEIRADLEERNSARDQAIVLSRQVIRHCSESIRAIHRRDWDASRLQTRRCERWRARTESCRC